MQRHPHDEGVSARYYKGVVESSAVPEAATVLHFLSFLTGIGPFLLMPVFLTTTAMIPSSASVAQAAAL
jgi:hypothetical protein